LTSTATVRPPRWPRAAAEQVDRPDRGRPLAAHEDEALLDLSGERGEEHLEVGLHAVLHEARVLAEVVGRIAEALEDGDRERLAPRVGHHDAVVVLRDRVGRVHPVDRLVGAAVGVDGDAAVALDHDEAHRLGERGVESTGVGDGAAGDEQAHRVSLSRRGGDRQARTRVRMRRWISSRRSRSSR
jgi:hypothetical protein